MCRRDESYYGWVYWFTLSSGFQGQLGGIGELSVGESQGLTDLHSAGCVDVACTHNSCMGCAWYICTALHMVRCKYCAAGWISALWVAHREHRTAFICVFDHCTHTTHSWLPRTAQDGCRLYDGQRARGICSKSISSSCTIHLADRNAVV